MLQVDWALRPVVNGNVGVKGGLISVCHSVDFRVGRWPEMRSDTLLWLHFMLLDIWMKVKSTCRRCARADSGSSTRDRAISETLTRHEAGAERIRVRMEMEPLEV